MTAVTIWAGYGQDRVATVTFVIRKKQTNISVDVNLLMM